MPQWAVQAPDGKVIQFPNEFTEVDVNREMLKMYPPTISDLANKALAAQGLSLSAPASPSQPAVNMQESYAPKIARAATSTLPALGAIGGAVVGAPAAGAGGLLGAALGGAGGEAAKLAIDRNLFGSDETNPLSVAGVKKMALSGAIAGAAEVPGAVMSTVGKALVGKVALMKSSKQVGDAVQGILESNPTALSKQMLLRDVNSAAHEEAVALRTSLGNAQQAVNVDTVLQNARNAASSTVQAQPVLKALPKRFEMMVAAAKNNAGITGSQATPQQLFDFMQQIGKPAYRGNPGPVSEVLSNLSKQVYRDAGTTIRSVAPEADASLAKLTNYHAATDAISRYQPGAIAALAISAHANPVTTALVSPVVAAGTPLAVSHIRKAVGSLSSEFLK